MTITPEQHLARRALARRINAAIANGDRFPIEENVDRLLDVAISFAHEIATQETLIIRHAGRDNEELALAHCPVDCACRASALRTVVRAVERFVIDHDQGNERIVPPDHHYADDSELREIAAMNVVDVTPVPSTPPPDAIETALEYVARASKGPAVWVEPVTGTDHPLLAIADMLYANAGLRDDQWSDIRGALKSIDLPRVPIHGVSIPIVGETPDDVRNGGEHRVVAITGGGPTSEHNARLITLMLEPVIGYAAVLLEVKRLRAENEILRAAADDVASVREARHLRIENAELESAFATLRESLRRYADDHSTTSLNDVLDQAGASRLCEADGCLRDDGHSGEHVTARQLVRLHEFISRRADSDIAQLNCGEVRTLLRRAGVV